MSNTSITVYTSDAQAARSQAAVLPIITTVGWIVGCLIHPDNLLYAVLWGAVTAALWLVWARTTFLTGPMPRRGEPGRRSGLSIETHSAAALRQGR